MGRLVVLGGGESGVGTAILGKKEGFEVFVSDKGMIKEEYRKVLEHFEIDWEEGQHTEEKILNADLVMKSPGIPDSVPLAVKLRDAGVPIISEIEFASRYTKATLIGITGSNGKTTTTMLTNHILKEGGLHVGMAGNIGDSYAKMVAEKDFDFYVLEISSFQLDGIVDFRPHIAILTNITPDHLDRYDYKFENYIASKFRIAKNQTKEDYLIYDADDEVIVQWLQKNPVRSKLLPFSLKKILDEGAYLENDKIIIKTHNNTIEMTTDALALEGKHNVKNTMAATTAAKLISIRKETIRRSIENFQGAEHRLEKVLKIHHVQYINDSKATNVNAAYYALDSMKTPTVWIVGGVDKGNDYRELMPLVREKVKAIICLGTDNTKIKDAFGNVVDLMVETFAMEEAVKVAYKIAERGDTVLLSPACASFDLFKNYEDRGNQFKEAIKKL
ncbi:MULTISPECIES: UDP-N-acetylmuramoyl-L-alanine--D-glutamate ligase [unclassified Arenibacter]|uniref:UDP-N-acetylmuramoyl-L-alanine--D-glutamate ligase n=1 Tax=unclassified Arenibacter TaxID=2615047 RepID=UPI000E3528C0|nr:MULTISPECIES: UDP-N-acetylmuramoyl-L-alanine--D-glutamate ligase [unclassified Arenibacter]MCM4165024.1 UDP-N-acetylmuramoyl-L-alanine--D-glutamate ligase [Arenibacter sp. A80]RFT55429.1 UDP-N-acetylmuramoyl-L-alanine--D-glutamate ligase [Arenibacter sp. P308M17]